MGINQSRQIATTTHEPDDKTVLAWRVHLRDSGYLQNPKSDTEMHTSMSGVELDAQLLDMPDTAKARRDYHVRQHFANEYAAPSIHNIPQPVFVTAAEKDEFCKISNKTVETIKILILELIEQLDCDSTQSHYRDLWKRVKGKKKDDLVSFYEELQEEVVDQTMPLSALVE